MILANPDGLGKKMNETRCDMGGDLIAFPAMRKTTAGTLRVTMLPGERWWGLCNAFGREMPFTEATAFECDLRIENYAHQSLSLLCSDRGRAIWCPEPVGARIAGGEIALESDAGEPMMRNLEYAFPGRGYAGIRDEFLMGEDLLVAPVLEKGATSRRVVLPPGSWRADDGRTYDGPATIEADAPLARLPHFERIH